MLTFFFLHNLSLIIFHLGIQFNLVIIFGLNLMQIIILQIVKLY